ncbi:MAG: response regulator transcription factor [Deltaproteobacteria bacterium]|nr:response regulator transcription factor [Deltaproteobacteria bacterium]
MTDSLATPARIVIVEDDAHCVERMLRAFAEEPSVRVVAIEASVAGGCAALLRERPELLITDLGLPDGSGSELVRAVSEHQLTTLPLVITMFNDDKNVFDAIAAGALGYLVKDADARELVRGTLELLAGGSPMSPAIARRVLASFRGAQPKPSEPAAEDPDKPQLSAREREVLSLIVKGFRFDEIAALLGVSGTTISTYVQRIYKKLAVHSRAEAVYEATQLGLVKLAE